MITETGAVAGTRRALDSTILDDAVARQDTVTQLIAQIRRVGRGCPTRGCDRHRVHPAGGVDRAGPTNRANRGSRGTTQPPATSWPSALVGDAVALLAALDARVGLRRSMGWREAG